MSHLMSFGYGQLGKSELFNNLMYKLMPLGLYTDVTLTRVSDISVTIPAFTAYINDSANSLGARIENTANENVAIVSTTPYLIARLNWVNSVLNDFTLLSSNFGGITSSDIILGKANFAGSVLVDFDYTEQTMSPLSNNGADLNATLTAFGFPSVFVNSTPYTLSSGDKILTLFVDTTSGNITVNLPTASISNVNNLVYIYNVRGSNSVLIAATTYSISAGRLETFRCHQTNTSTYAWTREFVDEGQQGVTVPASTPEKIGQTFIDTTNKKTYIATGISSSLDWTNISQPLNNINITGTIVHAADTDHDLTFGITTAPDSTNTYMLQTAAPITRQIDAEFGTGNGGMYVGGTVAANTVYYMYLIRKDSDGTVNIYYDTSATASHIPTGHTHYRCIGAGVTDASSNWILGTWTRKANSVIMKYNTFFVDRAMSVTGTTNRILTTLSVPVNSFCKILLVTNITTGDAGFCYTYGDPSDVDTTPSVSYNYVNVDSRYIYTLFHDLEFQVNSSKQMYFRGNDATYIQFRVWTKGWELVL
jgi:hypothetical protein